MNRQTRQRYLFFTAHRNDEGEVDGDGEVCDGKHVEGRQFDELYRLDEALQVTASPASSDHRALHNVSQSRHKPTTQSTTRTRSSSTARPAIAAVRGTVGKGYERVRENGTSCRVSAEEVRMGKQRCLVLGSPERSTT